MKRTDVLEGRKYTAEDRMFEAAGKLGAGLHEVEHEFADLHEAIHTIVCESPRMPIEQKTAEVLDRLFRAVVVLDTEALRATARTVAGLKEEIDGYERELGEMRQSRRKELVVTAA
jgi:hypothetical protein